MGRGVEHCFRPEHQAVLEAIRSVQLSTAGGGAELSASNRPSDRPVPICVSSPRPFVLAVLGIAALCALDAAVKELTQSYAVAYAVLGRYVFGTAFALAVWWWQGRPRLTREMLPAHVLRGTLITFTAFLFFYALTRLGMAEAITLSFIAPLLIPPLAHLFLGERMRGPVVLAAFVGFAGVLSTVQGAPSFDGERALALAAILAAALTYALAAIVMRARAAKDGSTLADVDQRRHPDGVAVACRGRRTLAHVVGPGLGGTCRLVGQSWNPVARPRLCRGGSTSTRRAWNSPRCPGRRFSDGCSSMKRSGRRCGSARW